MDEKETLEFLCELDIGLSVMLYNLQDANAFVLLKRKLPEELCRMIVDMIVEKRENEECKKQQARVKTVSRLLCTEIFQDYAENVMSFGKMAGMKDEVRDFYDGFVWADQVRIVDIDMAKIAIFPTRRTSGIRASWNANDRTQAPANLLQTTFTVHGVFKAGGLGFPARKGWQYVIVHDLQGGVDFGNAAVGLAGYKILVNDPTALQMYAAA